MELQFHIALGNVAKPLIYRNNSSVLNYII